jgi:two-component system cell cycle response regulator
VTQSKLPSKTTSMAASSGLIVISVAVAAIYWYIDMLQLGPMLTRVITTVLFVAYASLTQYFINTIKRMAEEVLSLSLSDHLTGLHNRRGFMILAEHQMEIGKRTEGSMMLLFADIDDLKLINDTHGHAKGDKVIADVGEIFRNVFRESDIIARIGGDEFVALALIGGGDSESAIEERIEQGIDAYNDATEDTDSGITISLGSVHIDADYDGSIDELIAKADALMYENKRRKPAIAS